jgi:hypothetical protein
LCRVEAASARTATQLFKTDPPPTSSASQKKLPRRMVNQAATMREIAVAEVVKVLETYTLVATVLPGSRMAT